VIVVGNVLQGLLAAGLEASDVTPKDRAA
jgi:hypothetical protein